MPKEITKKQQGLFFGDQSPFSEAKKRKIATEIREGKIRIKGKSGSRTSKRKKTRKKSRAGTSRSSSRR
jgi:hypothetical protein